QGRCRRPDPEDQLEPVAGIAGGTAHGAPAEGRAQLDPGRVLVLVRWHRADLAATGLRSDQPGRRADPVHLRAGLFSVGTGVGSLLCEKLSARTVEIGLVPLG